MPTWTVGVGIVLFEVFILPHFIGLFLRIKIKETAKIDLFCIIAFYESE